MNTKTGGALPPRTGLYVTCGYCGEEAELSIIDGELLLPEMEHDMRCRGSALASELYDDLVCDVRYR